MKQTVKDNKELCAQINLKELKSRETKHSYVNKGKRTLSYMQIVCRAERKSVREGQPRIQVKPVKFLMNLWAGLLI